ncbi:MAG: CusA/CzcA family heavy metal efflux RND transporter [Myxococcota bacterium]
MQEIFKFIIRNRRLVLALTLALVFFGAFAWRELRIDAFPDVTNQQVMIITEVEGLTSLDVERQITIPIESVMGGLPRIKNVRSLSKSGLSQVVVIFDDDVDTYFARQVVFERLQLAKSKLPPNVEPELGPISTGLGEIFQYTLESEKHSLMELRTVQEWLISRRLRSIPGVNEVNIFGGYVKQYHVIVQPEKLLKYNLTLNDVLEAVASNNANAGGSFIVKDWEQSYIRSVGVFSSTKDLETLVLAGKDGTPVYLSDVAEVKVGHQTRQGAVSKDGRGEVVAGMVIMLKGENSKKVVESVKAAIPKIEEALPEGMKINPFYDRTDLIKACIDTVYSAIFQGCILVLLVLFLIFHSLRPAALVSLSLPIVVFIVFILMKAADITADLMSLGGLVIAIGMIVDSSIVVIENIIRHLKDASFSKKPKEVIFASAIDEVVRPISFSILIIIIVITPLFSMEDMEGKMFSPLALTMIFAMFASLTVALIIMPTLGYYLFNIETTKFSESRFVVTAVGNYKKVLSKLIGNYKSVLVVLVAMFIITFALFSKLGTEFLPHLDEGAIALNVVRLPNASLDGSVALAKFIEEESLKFPEVKTVVSKTGRAEISEDPMGPEQNDILIILKPKNEWNSGRSKEELIEAMQESFAKIPGIRVSFSQPIALRVNELISGVKSDMAIKIFGEDIKILKEFADRIATVLSSIKGAEDIKIEQVSGYNYIEIIPKREIMARYKLNNGAINEIVETAIGGKVATTIVEGEKRFEVLVRFPPEKRKDADVMRRILIPTNEGASVPLGLVADFRETEGPSQISREGNMRRVLVEANIRGRDVGGFVKEAQSKLASIKTFLPPGYWLEYGGSFENQQRAMKRFAFIVPISIVAIYLLLFMALGALKPALLVLINLPFALVGGVISMFIFGINLSVSATIGFIVLFGAAIQNGTILVSFINQLVESGVSLRDAVIEGSALRFRALIMTTVTTVLGLLPMLYATGSGAEIQRPLAIVVIGGLISSTALTLLVLPIFYRFTLRKTSIESFLAERE